MIQRGAKIAIVQANERLAGPDIVIVLDQDLGDEPGDMRRYRRDVASDIGVVGRFDEAPDGPPFKTEPRAGRCERRPQGLPGERPASDPLRDAPEYAPI
jgi:hypothetical protein